jgi:hypothetical protein
VRTRKAHSRIHLSNRNNKKASGLLLRCDLRFASCQLPAAKHCFILNFKMERLIKKPRIRILLKVMLVVFVWRVPIFWEAILDMHRYAQQHSYANQDAFLSPELRGTADGDLGSGRSSQTSVSIQECEIPENHTAMDANWLRVVTKYKWMPTGGLKDGIFAPEWYPTLDCPAAFRTLVWVA